MICEVCHSKQASQDHHLFSQTKANKKLYGDLIHNRRNLMRICADCHLTKPIPKFTEVEFCMVMGIRPRSKAEQFRRREE